MPHRVPRLGTHNPAKLIRLTIRRSWRLFNPENDTGVHWPFDIPVRQSADFRRFSKDIMGAPLLGGVARSGDSQRRIARGDLNAPFRYVVFGTAPDHRQRSAGLDHSLVPPYRRHHLGCAVVVLPPDECALYEAR